MCSREPVLPLTFTTPFEALLSLSLCLCLSPSLPFFSSVPESLSPLHPSLPPVSYFLQGSDDDDEDEVAPEVETEGAPGAEGEDRDNRELNPEDGQVASSVLSKVRTLSALPFKAYLTGSHV
jgi:hypothetical protein